MSNFWNCICQPAQAKYAIDELLRQLNRLANGDAEAGNGDGLDVPERGLQVSPFMMFMLFMGMVYVVLTLQQRATRQDRIGPDAKGGGGGAGDGGDDAGGGGGDEQRATAPGPGPAVD